MTISDRLARLGVDLPAVPAPIGAFLPARLHGNVLFVSGQLPLVGGAPMVTGAMGPGGLDQETGYACARQCAINGLAAASSVLGSLESVRGVIRVGGFVVSRPGFTGQPAVVNGASDLLIDVFGEAGRHARAAVGVAALPLDCPVEVELTLAIG